MTDPRALSVRVLAGALMGAIVMIALAISFVLTDKGTLPRLPLLLAPVVAGVVVHVLLESIGYRAEPLKPGETDPGISLQRFQTPMFLRFAVIEAIALACLAGAFVITEGGYILFLTGAVVALVLMAVHVWPGRRPVGKVADQLEAGGVASPLRGLFGYESRGGAVQEL